MPAASSLLLSTVETRKTEELKFTVRVVGSSADLQAACEVRAAAYGAVLPELGRAMLTPDSLDTRADVVVLLAHEKATGRPIATARMATNEGQPLLIEQCFELPHEFLGLRLGEVTRLAVHPDNEDPLVRMALMKAMFMICRARLIDQTVVGVRRPGMLRNYRYLGFVALTKEPVPLTYAGGLRHHVMAADTRNLEQRYRASGHPWYEWGFATHHLDIQIDDTDLLRV